MSTRPLTVIDTGYRKVTKAVVAFEQAKDKKAKAIAKAKIKPALKDYLNDVVIYKIKGDIVDDPNGILFCDNLKYDFMIYDVVDSLYDLRKESDDMKDAIDNIMCHGVETGRINRWTMIYRKGVHAVVTNSAVVFMVNGTKTIMKWTKDTFDGLVQWLKEKLDDMFYPDKKAVVST